MFGLGKKIASAVVSEVKGANGENTDLLEAGCAAGALAAAGDGDISKDEKAKALSVLLNHKKIGVIYKSTDIEKMVDQMFKMAETSSGRQSLARELADLKKHPDAKAMQEDCYLIAKDVIDAGGMDAAEEAQLAKIAKVLDVKAEDFLF